MTDALLDAGPMVSLFDRGDPAHAHYRELVAERSVVRRLLTTWPCITEASHLLADIERIEMLRWVGLGGVQVFGFDQAAVLDMAPWMQAYTEGRRSRMDFADASLLWLARETDVRRIITLDVRDFSRYRLPDGRAFELL